MNIILQFFLWFLLALGLLTAAQLFLRKRLRTPAARALTAAGKALLAVGLAVLAMAGPVQLRPLQPLMLALYAALLPDALADAVCAVYEKARKKERRFAAYKTLSLALGVLFFAFGVINMETVTPRSHTYTSGKLETEHTVVFLADLHVGSAQPTGVTEKTVAALGALKADAVILGGDIVDDYTTKEEMEALCALFADFETPVYYIYGNHDRQGHAEYAGGRKFTPEALEAALTRNGVTVLKDEYAVLAPDLTLLGREDLSEGDGRKPIESLENPAPGTFLIVADHQPGDFKKHAAAGADLQLSGHTHAGQLFPLGVFYGLASYCAGDYTEGNSIMNVTPGACGWRMPIRTQARCTYEIISLKPERSPDV